MKAEWKCVNMVFGEQSVMIFCHKWMQELFVVNLDTMIAVSFHVYFLIYILSCLDVVSFVGGTFGQGTGPIHVDNLDCVGNERRMLDCLYDSHTDDCNHSEDAGVACYNQSKPLIYHTSLSCDTFTYTCTCIYVIFATLRLGL